jgi:hypothetical protein
VQAYRIKTRLESAPGVCNQRLKLKCDEPLSNVDFKFNMRRYTKAAADGDGLYPRKRLADCLAGGAWYTLLEYSTSYDAM